MSAMIRGLACALLALPQPAGPARHAVPQPAGPARRELLCVTASVLLGMPARSAKARTPGSSDLQEAVEQIRDAAVALKGLQQDWSKYAIIDAEGRAGNIDAARRILGGVAPQRGAAAIEVAKKTPLCAQPAVIHSLPAV